MYIYIQYIYIYYIIYISIEQLDRLVCRQIANSRYSSQEGVCKDNTRNKNRVTGWQGSARAFKAVLLGFGSRSFLVEFIRPQKVYTFVFRVGNILPKSVKCIHSATKLGFRVSGK